MSRRIRIPGLVDLTLVDDPDEIRELVAAPELNRRFGPHGPLVNRFITRRIRRWFQVDGVPLPSLAPREDSQRAEHQKSLHAALQPNGGKPLWTEAQLSRLSGYVRGGTAREEMGVAAQEIVGRLFDPAYTADRASWAAAEMIDAFRDGGPLTLPRDLYWTVSGKLGRARKLLIERAKHDRFAMHGTAIGVHGIVHAIDRMRALRSERTSDSIADEVAVGRCLHPPQRVPRSVESMLSTPAAEAPLPPGAVVMLELEKAGPRAPGPEVMFMHGHWNYCPAEDFVPALLRAVWREAAA